MIGGELNIIAVYGCFNKFNVTVRCYVNNLEILILNVAVFLRNKELNLELLAVNGNDSCTLCEVDVVSYENLYSLSVYSVVRVNINDTTVDEVVSIKSVNSLNLNDCVAVIGKLVIELRLTCNGNSSGEKVCTGVIVICCIFTLKSEFCLNGVGTAKLLRITGIGNVKHAENSLVTGYVDAVRSSVIGEGCVLKLKAACIKVSLCNRPLKRGSLSTVCYNVVCVSGLNEYKCLVRACVGCSVTVIVIYSRACGKGSFINNYGLLCTAINKRIKSIIVPLDSCKVVSSDNLLCYAPGLACEGVLCSKLTANLELVVSIANESSGSGVVACIGLIYVAAVVNGNALIGEVVKSKGYVTNCAGCVCESRLAPGVLKLGNVNDLGKNLPLPYSIETLNCVKLGVIINRLNLYYVRACIFSGKNGIGCEGDIKFIKICTGKSCCPLLTVVHNDGLTVVNGKGECGKIYNSLGNYRNIGTVRLLVGSVKLYVLIGHLNVLCALCVEPTDESCLGSVVGEEVKVCTLRKKALSDELAILVIVLNLIDSRYVYVDVKSDCVISVVRIGNELEHIDNVLGVLRELAVELSKKLINNLLGGNCMIALVAKVAVGILKLIVRILMLEYAEYGVIHVLVGNSCNNLFKNDICIMLCKVEVLFKLCNYSLHVLVGITGKVNVLLDRLLIEEAFKVYSLNKLLYVLEGKILIECIEVITVCHECSEYLMLKSIGKLAAVSCSENELGESFRNGNIKIYNAVNILNVNVVSDDASNSSYLVISAAKLSGNGEFNVTEVGGKNDGVRKLHLIVGHLRNLCRSGKIKHKILKRGGVNLHLAVVAVDNLSTDREVTHGLNSGKENLHNAGVANYRANTEIVKELCLCILKELVVVCIYLNKYCSKLCKVVLCKISNGGIEIGMTCVKLSDESLNVVFCDNLYNVGVSFCYELVCLSVKSLLELVKRLGTVCDVVLNLNTVEGVEEVVGLFLNKSINYSVSKVKKSCGKLNAVVEKPLLVFCYVICNLAVGKLGVNSAVHIVFCLVDYLCQEFLYHRLVEILYVLEKSVDIGCQGNDYLVSAVTMLELFDLEPLIVIITNGSRFLHFCLLGLGLSYEAGCIANNGSYSAEHHDQDEKHCQK